MRCVVEFQVQRYTLCYWKRQRPEAYGSLDEGHPCFILSVKSDNVWAIPAFEYPTHIKVRRDDDEVDDA